jgi:hypothetical protein
MAHQVEAALADYYRVRLHLLWAPHTQYKLVLEGLIQDRQHRAPEAVTDSVVIFLDLDLLL